MKKLNYLFCCVSLCLLMQACETINLDALLGSAGRDGPLSLKTVTAGLKEALKIGAANAVKDVTGKNGFTKNITKKILLPKELEPVEKKLRSFRMGFLVDNFENKMNQAAEKAASKATPVFIKAIKEMTFADARKILNGNDTAATEYFKSKTGPELKTMFAPIIKNSLDEYGVISIYDDMLSKYNSIPFAKKVNFKMENYITDKTLNTLFSALANEEKQIRTEPVARTTELLKKVFGK